MWDNLSYYNVSTERKALEIIFDYLQLDMLTKPECSLASNNYPLSQGLTLSKEAGTLPTSFDAFRRKVLSADWEVVLCIAGTDKSDIRRVVFLYYRDEKSFIVNFPNGGKLTENETAIKSWIDSRLK